MPRIKLKPAGLAIVAGGGIGFLVYNMKASAPACVLDNGISIPDSTQTLWQAVQGAKSHLAEDASLGVGGLFDMFVKANSFGLIDTTVAADIYGWWENLTPEQQDAVNNVETNGGLACVEQETTSQVYTAGTSMLSALAAGLLVYAAASTFGVE